MKHHEVTCIYWHSDSRARASPGGHPHRVCGFILRWKLEDGCKDLHGSFVLLLQPQQGRAVPHVPLVLVCTAVRHQRQQNGQMLL